MAGNVFRREFKLANFLYQWPNDKVFYTCQWRWPRPVYPVIRWILSLYTIYGLTHRIVVFYVDELPTHGDPKLDDNGDPILDSDGNPKTKFVQSLFVFFTIWSYIVLTLYFLVAALLSVIFYKKVNYASWNGKDFEVNEHQLATISIEGTENENRELTNNNTTKSKRNVPFTYFPIEKGGRLRSYFIFCWILSDICNISHPIVTVIYFVALYDSSNVWIGLQNLNVHALNLVFVIVDQMINGRPIRLLHVVIPILYGFVYGVFSLIYWSSDHDNHILYKGVLDWNRPGLSIGVTLGLMFGAIPALHLIYFGFQYLRLYIYYKVYGVAFHEDIEYKPSQIPEAY